ncbi:Lumazine-binding protein [Auriculariales sp. MPI-PUGE-AT-0066]|nr:Lumazine-binding protein [Auriculariales sp. MPI-PUGE-AT-0066]
MFTGIVEHLGLIEDIQQLDTSESGGGGWSLTIGSSAPILGDCHIGDSISVNGCCLTVTEFNRESFKVGLAPETLSKTNLGELKVGDNVDLERAVNGHVRFGGHFVQGHIDTTATIISRTEDGNSLRLLFKLPAPTAGQNSLLPYLIPKGFIAIDGASLTLTYVNDADATFGVMLIAHTQAKIVLAAKQVGANVNIEVDMVGKYVEKAVLASLGSDGTAAGSGLVGIIERVVEKVLANKSSA